MSYYSSSELHDITRRDIAYIALELVNVHHNDQSPDSILLWYNRITAKL
jgi:hypothetical protein